MSKRKSIVSAFGDFRADKPKEQEVVKPEVEESKPKAKRVAAGIIGTTQRTLTQIREERDALLEQATSSSQIVSLDPNVIDPSPFRDRLPDDNETDFEAFKSSIDAEGQQVQITVRTNPEDENRFQVVYGHRRWRALKELGKNVDAVIREYSDRDLVIAQGIENASRQDLTWIERALFAHEMQSAGIKPKDIKAALSVDDTELSKFRSVLKVLPANIIETIGRAPSIGRPRWLELASLTTSKSDVGKLEKTLAAAKVLEAPSDQRFAAALSALSVSDRKSSPAQDQLNLDLDEVGTMTVSSNAIKINLAKEHREGFSKFLEAEMKDLLKRYKSSLE